MHRKQMLTTAMIFTLFLLLGCHQNPVVKSDEPKLTRAEAEIEKQTDKLRQLIMVPNDKEIGEQTLKIGEQLKDNTDMIHTIMKYQVAAYAFAKAAVVAESVSPDKPDKITYADRGIEAANKSLFLIHLESDQGNRKDRKVYNWIVANGRKGLSHIILAACFSIKARSGDISAFEQVRINVNFIRPDDINRCLSEIQAYFPMICYPEKTSSLGKIYPIDEGKDEPSFLEFRENLLKVLQERKGFESLEPFISPYIVYSDYFPDIFTDEINIESFKNNWRPDDRNSPLWDTLTKILNGGGVFHKEYEEPLYFIAPYLNALWPYELKGWEYMVATQDCSVLAEPDYKADVILRLSNDIVKVEDCINRFISITTSDCRKEYVYNSDLYRYNCGSSAIFGKENGKWTIRAIKYGNCKEPECSYTYNLNPVGPVKWEP